MICVAWYLVLRDVPSLSDSPKLRVVEHLETLQQLVVQEHSQGVQVVVGEQPRHHLHRHQQEDQTDGGCQQGQTVQTHSTQPQHGQCAGDHP